jgi:hypothetical protein
MSLFFLIVFALASCQVSFYATGLKSMTATLSASEKCLIGFK